MEKIKEFYIALSVKKKFLLWVCAAVILFSAVKISYWQMRKGNIPKEKEYVKKLTSRSSEEKKFAIYETGRRQIQSAVPALEKIIREDTDIEMKRAASWSLGKIKTERLFVIFDDSQRDVKEIIAESLLKLDKTNIYLLFDRFSSEDRDGKILILSYVDESAEKRLFSRVMEVAEEGQESFIVREKALKTAFRYMPAEEIEGRLRNLYYQDPDDNIKRIANNLMKELKEQKR